MRKPLDFQTVYKAHLSTFLGVSLGKRERYRRADRCHVHPGIQTVDPKSVN